MAKPLIKMALDSLEFEKLKQCLRTRTPFFIIEGREVNKPISLKTPSVKMPWERLNKSAYKGGKNG